MGRRKSESSSQSPPSHSPSPRKERRTYRSSRSRSHDRRARDYSPPPARQPRRYDSRSPDHRRGRRAENPPPSKCIGIFGLSIYTDEGTIRDIFSKFGSVKRIAMIHCPQVS